ncbi:MAG: NAD(P)H-hydrate dehydratase [Planctomycetota bacterium]|nr:NAD(P)H-hydrate dehydratase [Planctomycetota bacterium]
MLPETPLPDWPARTRESHKGDYGRVLLLGGARGMAGSIALAGMSALRGGAGLVTLGLPIGILPTVAAYEPSYMTLGLAEDADGRMSTHAIDRILESAADCHVVACGPGMGRGRGIVALVTQLYRQLVQPMVIDADAINALAERPRGLSDAGGPRVLTPHPGEFCRLVHSDLRHRSAARQMAQQVAAEHNVVVVLKGHRTFVTNGDACYENQTGNPGMATGGSGDVLTGLVTALLAQRFSTWQGACLGVHLHGAAGDRAANEFGEVSLIASDIVKCLPLAIREYRQRPPH